MPALGIRHVLSAASFAATVAIAGHSHASEGFGALELIDMTSLAELDLGFSARDVMADLGGAALEAPVLALSGSAIEVQPEPIFAPGWNGVVDLEMTGEPTLDDVGGTAFDDRFMDPVQRRKMRGFYTMRYQFGDDDVFRPYAGAGLGVVAESVGEATGSSVAGRATAGFDMAMDERSAFFAEYAFVRSGGVDVGKGDGLGGATLRDSEHRLKLGFRRTF